MGKPKFFEPPAPMLQVRHSSLIFYKQFATAGRRNISGFLKPTYTGTTTTGVKKRIRKAIDLLCQYSPPRKTINPVTLKIFTHSLSFITLTIQLNDTKPDAAWTNKNLLAPFMRIMRNKKTLITYVWKAEFQKNGMIHYHITTPSVIHYQFIKDTWNNILKKHSLLDKYYREHPGQEPNSTDIHSVYKKKDIAWYLSKEISKTVQDMTTTGKIWDCSENLKNRKFFSMIEPSALDSKLDQKNMTHLEQCSIYKKETPWKLLPAKDQDTYNNWRMQIIEKGMY